MLATHKINIDLDSIIIKQDKILERLANPKI